MTPLLPGRANVQFPMDTLTVIGLQNVQEAIYAAEKRWPSLAYENAEIRFLAPVLKSMGMSDDMILSALVSDCRSDLHNCGRCALRFRKNA